MNLGFDLEERLAGSYWMLDEPLVDRAIRLDLRARVDRLERFGFDRTADLAGRVEAEGLTAGSAVEGTSRFGTGGAQRQTFELWFEAPERPAAPWLRLRGQRDFQLHAWTDALTVVPFSLYDSRAQEIGRGTLRFDPKRELARVLGSARVRLTSSWLGGRGLSFGFGGRMVRLEGPRAQGGERSTGVGGRP